ncbi:uncharacterized protein N7511_007630 [Penicillium nucicola]|uniref:uncharacterized protein n=1 Tax=Penicillium nucicola TaxID=1850975 RepID=UPI0025455F96|nr:uncharacterized protein N7511_007630 [Penicillium nucicola]KAJ5753477.1 hypothetical protein N7511_007630 [Penicillium nucicola]
MASVTETGHVGNLTTSEEEKLREFWRMLIQSWDEEVPSPDGASAVNPDSAPKANRRLFSLSRAPAEPTESETSAIPAKLLTTVKGLNASPIETKTIQTLLLKLPGDRLRSALLALFKQDHPDAVLLRFLRAEKWNIPKAWIKLVSALNWRVNEYKVDEEVLAKGEAYALEQSQMETQSSAKKDGEGFILQATTGKGHFHGCDKMGRPICVVRVRAHDPSTQTQKALNDFIIQCIETVRLLQVPPVESMAIVFDLTSFTLGNWEFPPVKFIIDCFQENYPESLGAMIFYNAPWIFSSFWKLINGILDPVVAAKVHFITGAKALEELIPREHILKELGGEEDWEYEYVEPVAGENDKLADITARDVILTERDTIGARLFSLTTQWIADPKTDLESRNQTVDKLRQNYWELDPYVRARTVLDRTGVIQGDGTVNFYPVVKNAISATTDETTEKRMGDLKETPAPVAV